MMGGATSSIRLLPVTAQNAESLEGELRCGFTDEDERNTLFLAAANVGDESRATAVINNRGMGITLVASEPGVFSTLDDGGTFDSQVFTATLVPGEEIDGGQSGAGPLTNGSCGGAYSAPKISGSHFSRSRATRSSSMNW